MSIPPFADTDGMDIGEETPSVVSNRSLPNTSMSFESPVASNYSELIFESETTTRTEVSSIQIESIDHAADQLENSTAHLEQGLAGLMNIQNEIKKLRHSIEVKEEQVRTVSKAREVLRKDYTDIQETLQEERSRVSTTLNELEKERHQSVSLSKKLKDTLKYVGDIDHENEGLKCAIDDLEDQVDQLQQAEETNQLKLQQFNEEIKHSLTTLKEKHQTELKTLQDKCQMWGLQVKRATENEKEANQRFEARLATLRDHHCESLNKALKKARDETSGDLESFRVKVEGFAHEASRSDIDPELRDTVHALSKELKEWNTSQTALTKLKKTYSCKINNYLTEIQIMKKSYLELQRKNETLEGESADLAKAREELSVILQQRVEDVAQAENRCVDMESTVTRLSADAEQKDIVLNTQEKLIDKSFSEMSACHKKVYEFANKLPAIDNMLNANSDLIMQQRSDKSTIIQLKGALSATVEKMNSIERRFEQLNSSEPGWTALVEDLLKHLDQQSHVFNEKTPVLYEAALDRPITNIESEYLSKVRPSIDLEADLKRIDETSLDYQKLKGQEMLDAARTKDCQTYTQKITLIKQRQCESIEELRISYENMVKEETARQTDTLMRLQSKCDQEVSELLRKFKALEQSAIQERRTLEAQLEKANEDGRSSSVRYDMLTKEISTLMNQPGVEIHLPSHEGSLAKAKKAVSTAQTGMTQMALKHAKEVKLLEVSHASNLEALQTQYREATGRVIETLNVKYDEQVKVVKTKEKSLNVSLEELKNVIKSLVEEAHTDRTKNVDHSKNEAQLEEKICALKTSLARAHGELETFTADDTNKIDLDLTRLKETFDKYLAAINEGSHELTLGLGRLSTNTKNESDNLRNRVENLEKKLIDAQKKIDSGDSYRTEIGRLESSLNRALKALKEAESQSDNRADLRGEIEKLRAELSVNEDFRTKEISSRLTLLLESIDRKLGVLDEKKEVVVANFQSIADHMKVLNYSAMESLSGIVIGDMIRKEIGEKDAELERLRAVIDKNQGASGDADRNELYIVQCKLNVLEADLDRKNDLIENSIKTHGNVQDSLKLRASEMMRKYDKATDELEDLKADNERLRELMSSNDDNDINEKIESLRKVYEQKADHDMKLNEQNLLELKEQYESHMATLNADNAGLQAQLKSLQMTLARQKQSIMHASRDIHAIVNDNREAMDIYHSLSGSTLSSGLFSNLYKLAVKLLSGRSSSPRSIESSSLAVEGERTSDNLRSMPNPLTNVTIDPLSNKRSNSDETPNAKRRRITEQLSEYRFNQWTQSQEATTKRR